MATHSSILAWEILWTRGAWQATVHGVARVGYTWLPFSFALELSNDPYLIRETFLDQLSSKNDRVLSSLFLFPCCVYLHGI